MQNVWSGYSLSEESPFKRCGALDCVISYFLTIPDKMDVQIAVCKQMHWITI